MRSLYCGVAATALLLVGGCGRDEAETKTSGVSVAVDAENDKAAEIDVDTSDVNTSDVSGKVAVSLPGGLQADIKMPKGMSGDGVDAKFDIDGVGLYPGAKVGAFNVRAFDGKSGDNAVVKIGFTAPADAAAVADWYQRQFEAKGIAVSRSGEMLSGKQKDGDDFTLAMVPAAGGSTGTLTIADKDNS